MHGTRTAALQPLRVGAGPGHVARPDLGPATEEVGGGGTRAEERRAHVLARPPNPHATHRVKPARAERRRAASAARECVSDPPESGAPFLTVPTAATPSGVTSARGCCRFPRPPPERGVPAPVLRPFFCDVPINVGLEKRAGTAAPTVKSPASRRLLPRGASEPGTSSRACPRSGDPRARAAAPAAPGFAARLPGRSVPGVRVRGAAEVL